MKLDYLCCNKPHDEPEIFFESEDERKYIERLRGRIKDLRSETSFFRTAFYVGTFLAINIGGCAEFRRMKGHIETNFPDQYEIIYNGPNEK